MPPSTKIRRRVALPLLLSILLAGGLLYWFGETWLRHLLLYLSTAGWARTLVSTTPLAQRAARRFVAGEQVDQAIAVARDLNARGMRVTLDLLGEGVSTIDEAARARDEILRLLDKIDEEDVDATVSVKLSQLGLKIDGAQTYEYIRAIVAKAEEKNNRIRIDMEESAVVDKTLEIFNRLRYEDGFDNVGIVVQAYLFRTAQDVAKLVDEGASVRLCKGAYMEPAHVAFPAKADTDRNFVSLVQTLLNEEARQNGVFLGVATHDPNMIAATKQYTSQEGINAQEFEFQMLYGVRRELQESLVNEGYQVRVYVPYGTAWYPYFVRRLAERPANLWFFLSNLFR